MMGSGASLRSILLQRPLFYPRRQKQTVRRRPKSDVRSNSLDACFPAALVVACLAGAGFFGAVTGCAPRNLRQKDKTGRRRKVRGSRSQTVRTGTAVAQMRPDAIPARHPAQGLWLPHRIVPKTAHALVDAMLASPACLAGQGCSATFVPARSFRGCWRCLRKEDGRGPGREPGSQTLP